MSERIDRVEGVLTPIEWDAKGRPCAYSLFTWEEEDIVIQEFPKKKKLQKLKNHFVALEGKVFKNSYGEKFIRAFKVKKLRRKPFPQKSRNCEEEFAPLLPSGDNFKDAV